MRLIFCEVVFAISSESFFTYLLFGYRCKHKTELTNSKMWWLQDFIFFWGGGGGEGGHGRIHNGIPLDVQEPLYGLLRMVNNICGLNYVFFISVVNYGEVFKHIYEEN